MPSNAQLIATILCGGLGGSMLTLWVKRERPTVVTYSIATSTIATDAPAKFIPNLKLEIGTEVIPVVHTHVVTLAAQSGPQMDKFEVEITFPPPVRIFGVNGESPSKTMHKIQCDPIRDGVKCTLSPVGTHKPNTYRINIATDQKQPNEPVSVNTVEFLKSEELLSSKSQYLAYVTWSAMLLGLVAGVFSYIIARGQWLRRHLPKEALRLPTVEVEASEGIDVHPSP